MKGLVLVAVAFLVSCSTAKKDSTPPTASTAILDYQTQILENGLRIIWVRDAKLPIVSLAMAIRGGGSHDPKGKEGLADMTAKLLDKGIPGKNAITIAEELEQRADSFGASVDSDATFVGIRGLSFHSEDTLKDFYQLVIKPTFPAAELERQRKVTLARLARVVDRPSDFTEMVFQKYIYGDHPYFHDGVGTTKGVKRISRADVQAFHSKHYAPGNTTMVVVGKFDNQFKELVVKTFLNWQAPKAPLAKVPPPPRTPGMQILEVEKPGLQQTEVRMGHLGVRRNIPDHLALKVANSILGDSGFFGARLFSEIRIKRGLTYSVRSHFDQRLEEGPFVISTFTRNDKIYEMVDELLNVVKTFRDKGVTQTEVDAAKSGLIGRFPRMVETGDDLAHQLLILDLYGISYDYLKNFERDMANVTVADVNAAIQKHFQPDNLKIVVFGPVLNKDMELLKKLAPVQVQSYKQSL